MLVYQRVIITCHDEKHGDSSRPYQRVPFPEVDHLKEVPWNPLQSSWRKPFAKNAEKNTPGHGFFAKAKERGTAMLACDCCCFGLDIDDQVGLIKWGLIKWDTVTQFKLFIA